MYYSKETENTPITILMGRCPYCKQTAKLLVYKATTSGCIWIIPYSFDSDYSINCGNCFARFKIPKSLGNDIEWHKYDDHVIAFGFDEQYHLQAYAKPIGGSDQDIRQISMR